MPLSDSPIQMPARKFESDGKAHRSNNQAIEQFGQFATYGFVPLGSVVAYLGALAPPGWLECDDSDINRHDYAALFDLIGTTYGVGDGSTTFGLPSAADIGTLPTGGMWIIRTGAI